MTRAGMKAASCTILATLMLAAGTWAAAANAAAPEGVGVFAPEAAFRGSLGELARAERITKDGLPVKADRPPVLVSSKSVAACDGESGQVIFYARQGERLTKRCAVAMEGPRGKKSYRVLASEADGGLGVEVFSAADGPDYSLHMRADGICEFRPGKSERLTVRDALLRYAIVPSFIGGDFIYHAERESPSDRLYVPSLNLLVGLVEGEDSMLVGVWPPGKQSAALERSSEGALLDGFTFDMDGQPLSLASIEKPGIWHAESLRPAYLERDTAIGWKRPLEAKWIGNFFVDSEAIEWPFYFRHERVKLWGRWIRGWFYYPFWFEGDRTIVHFEKRFPPTGELLIYFLEAHPIHPDSSTGSPVGVMESVLGKEETAKLLDFEGVELRPLLAHMMAVCAMTNKMQEYFNAGEEVKRRAQIELWCDDVADFIRMIRDRVFEFDRFAAETSAFLARRAKVEPKLAEAIEPMQDTLAEIRETAENDLPSTSLETVRGWTKEMSGYAVQVRPGNNKRYEKLAAQCRSVAGTQDDLARALSILAIRLTQEAAQMGMESPEHARLAEEVIQQARQVIRKPTWWEPRREYLPKSDPGRP